mmetsp:Transcript_19284/g.61370  ORF Transcript_19284/g.61370 Transcript_19284/m.61370 type:complete len:397 (-) Transcript_19284:175-1365(-)
MLSTLAAQSSGTLAAGSAGTRRLLGGHLWDHFECDCSWRSKYACPLDELFLTKIDRSGDGHIDRHEAIDLNADGFLTSTELAAADMDGDGQSTKHEAILARTHAGTDGFATDDGSACFKFCCKTPSPPPSPPPPRPAPPPSPPPTDWFSIWLAAARPAADAAPPPPPPSPHDAEGATPRLFWVLAAALALGATVVLVLFATRSALVANTHSGPKAAPAAPGNGSPLSKTRSISFASIRLGEEMPGDLMPDGLPPVAATPAMDEVRRAEEAPEESAEGVFSAWELRDMLAPARPPPSASPPVVAPAKSRKELMAMIQEAAEAARLAQGNEAQAAEAQDPSDPDPLLPADPAPPSPLDLPPPTPHGASPSRRDAACRLLRSLLWAERPRKPAIASSLV